MLNKLRQITHLFIPISRVLNNSASSKNDHDCSKISVEKTSTGYNNIKAWVAMISNSGSFVRAYQIKKLTKQKSKQSAYLDDFIVKFANATLVSKQSLIIKVDVFFGFKSCKFSENFVSIPQFSRPEDPSFTNLSLIPINL